VSFSPGDAGRREAYAHLQVLVQLAITALVLVLFLQLLVSVQVVAPLRRLAAAAGRIAGGDLDRPVEERRDDELGDLAAAFEGMRERLRAGREIDRSRLEELRAAHAELLAMGAPQLAPSSVFLAWAGELDAAEAARGPAGPWRTLAAAVMAWRRGDPAAALPLAERAASTPEQLLVRRWALYFQGETLLDLGRYGEALATLGRHRQSRDAQVARGGFAIRSRMATARALRGLGRLDEAMAELDHVARVLRHADPGLAIVAEVRDLQGSLRAARGGARGSGP
jgi:HAMP domain-containing protein